MSAHIWRVQYFPNMFKTNKGMNNVFFKSLLPKIKFRLLDIHAEFHIFWQALGFEPTSLPNPNRDDNHYAIQHL